MRKRKTSPQIEFMETRRRQHPRRWRAAGERRLPRHGPRCSRHRLRMAVLRVLLWTAVAVHIDEEMTRELPVSGDAPGQTQRPVRLASAWKSTRRQRRGITACPDAWWSVSKTPGSGECPLSLCSHLAVVHRRIKLPTCRSPTPDPPLQGQRFTAAPADIAVRLRPIISIAPPRPEEILMRHQLSGEEWYPYRDVNAWKALTM